MRPLQTLSIIFYTILFIIIGTVFVAISFGLLTIEQIKVFYDTYDLRISVGLAGGIFILFGLLITHFTFGSIQRERTIAFNTADGQVLISLSAVENFIKRLASQMPEIKDMRSSVFANKKGVNISVKLSLWSDSNIPDVAEKIQSIIKGKVQDMLGIEEPIITKVHVAKIAHREAAESKKTQKVNELYPQPPYRNY